MKKGFALIAVIALSSVFVASIADAGTMQKKKKSTTQKRKSSGGGYSGPETGLLGIKLYDSGLKVISMYGNPDTITTVGGGTSTAGGGQGGPPGGFGGPGAGGPPGRAGASGGTSGGAAAAPIIPGGLVPGPFTGGDDKQSMATPNKKGGGAPSGPPSPGGRPGEDGPGAGGAGGAATEAAVFTRWSYIKNGCKLGFVVDKFDRVIQIEAIGLQNGRIKTRRGVGFGSSFSSVMKAYAPSADPDGYDISGNNFTIRFLTRQRVAFRLSQLSTKKAHVVTGIVVAAGKE